MCVVGLSPVTTGTPTDFSTTDFSTISTQIVSPYPTQQFTSAFDLDNKIITFYSISMDGIAGGGGGGGTMYDNESGSNGGYGNVLSLHFIKYNTYKQTTYLTFYSIFDLNLNCIKN